MTTVTVQKVYELIIRAGGSRQGAEEFKRSAEIIAAASERAAAAGKPIIDKALEAEKAYSRLQARIDPLVVAQNRLEKETRDVAAAFNAGIISMEQASRSITLIGQRYDRAVEAANRLRPVVRQGAGTFGQFGTAIQQAGFQVGDFAVQVASGQGMLRPFIQQGTQLISMFGPWGAVIGAAGAVVGALATSLWDVGDASDEVTSSTEAMASALRMADDLHKKLAGTMDLSIPALEATRDRNIEIEKGHLGAAQAAITQARAEAELMDILLQQDLARAPNEAAAEAINMAIADSMARVEKIKALNDELINGRMGEDGKYVDGIRGRLAALQFGTRDARVPMDPFNNMGQDFSDSYYNAAEGAKKLAEETEKAKKETRELLDAVARADAAGVAEYQKMMDDLGRAVDQADQAGLAEWQRTMDEGARIMESVRTPAEAYAATIERLNELLTAGAIDATTYYRATAKAQDAFDDASQSAQYLGQVGEQAFDDIGRAIGQAAMRGKAEFSSLRDVGLRVVDDLWNAFYELAINNPLKNLMTGGDDPTLNSAFGGVFDWLFGAASVGSGVTPSATAANGWSAYIQHSGGLAGTGTRRTVDPMLFAGAPRFHNGRFPGLAQDEIAAILQKDEIVVPANAGAASSMRSQAPAGEVKVNIIDQRSNQNSEQVETRRRRCAGGMEQIDVYIRDKMKKDIREGVFDKEMSSRYGQNVAPAR